MSNETTDFDKEIAIGVCFDISSGYFGKKTVLSLIKNSLVEVAVKLGLNSGIYVAGTKNNIMPRKQGESVEAICEFKLPSASTKDSIKQVVTVVGNQPRHVNKFVFILTDRFKSDDTYSYKKCSMINSIKGYQCKIFYIGLGKSYDKQALKQLEDSDVNVLHFDDPLEISQKILEILGI